MVISYENRPLQLVRFVAPFQTTWCSLEIYSFVSFKINYSYARKYLRIWKQWFSRVPSRGLKWGNKTYKLKRSISFQILGVKGLTSCTCCQDQVNVELIIVRNRQRLFIQCHHTECWVALVVRTKRGSDQRKGLLFIWRITTFIWLEGLKSEVVFMHVTK